MYQKIKLYEKGEIDLKTLAESYQGWQAYARLANTFNLREKVKRKMIDTIWDKV
jgi:hypothetical protein